MTSGVSVKCAGWTVERDVAPSVDYQDETSVSSIVHLFKHLYSPATIMRL